MYDIKKISFAEPIKVNFNFPQQVPASLVGQVLILRNEILSISSNGQIHFDLT